MNDYKQYAPTIEEINQPKGLQRRRVKGFKLPGNTVCVNRPTKFGNPFTLDLFTPIRAIELFEECLLNNACVYKYFKGDKAEKEYNRFKWMSENLHILRGKNLACFCKDVAICHRNILLKHANR